MQDQVQGAVAGRDVACESASCCGVCAMLDEKAHVHQEAGEVPRAVAVDQAHQGQASAVSYQKR